jgi:1-acyl-sn-glycerol-3-phosphate acyltransferase
MVRSLVRDLLRSTVGAAALDRLEGMEVEDTGFGYDRFGFERESFWAAYAFTRLLYTRWFRVASRGHEHLPERGRAILAGNHSGLLPFDGAMLSVDLIENLDPPRALRAIVDHFAFAVPYVGLFMQRTGQVPGTARNFADLLGQEEMVLVFPEGTRGIVKPFSERYRLKRFNVGFVELALDHKAPVIPFAVVGAEEQAPILFGSRRLGKPLGMPIFPITPTFPLLGPLGLVPYPSRYFINYGEPVLLHEQHPPSAARDPDALEEIAAGIQRQVEGLLRDGLAWREGSP